MKKRNKEYFKNYYQEHRKEILNRIQKQQDDKKREEELMKIQKHNPRYYKEIKANRPLYFQEFVDNKKSDIICCKSGDFLVDFD